MTNEIVILLSHTRLAASRRQPKHKWTKLNASSEKIMQRFTFNVLFYCDTRKWCSAHADGYIIIYGVAVLFHITRAVAMIGSNEDESRWMEIPLWAQTMTSTIDRLSRI